MNTQICAESIWNRGRIAQDAPWLCMKHFLLAGHSSWEGHQWAEPIVHMVAVSRNHCSEGHSLTRMHHTHCDSFLNHYGTFCAQAPSYGAQRPRYGATSSKIKWQVSIQQKKGGKGAMCATYSCFSNWLATFLIDSIWREWCTAAFSMGQFCNYPVLLLPGTAKHNF